VSDIDTVVVDSLKALDPEWPIREADIARAPLACPVSAISGQPTSRWESPLGSGACYLTGQQIPCASAAPRGGLEMIEVSRYILALIVALTHLQP
jgi:hypothetical protein